VIGLYNAAVQARNSARGFYNDNVRVETATGPVIVRIPIAEAHTMDLRIWPEQRVLPALTPYVTRVPKLLYVSYEPPFQVHEYITGEVLDAIAPCGNRVPSTVMRDVAELFAQLTNVPLRSLPGLPPAWPADEDTPALARQLSNITQRVYDTFQTEYHSLFAAFGIPNDPLAPVLARWSNLHSRPFTLVHADIHRKNMILHDGRVAFLDWELAIWGDPVYELAVHFHKMSYYDDERQALLDSWVKIMPPRYTQGWESDLDIYLAHERTKSAIVDTVRYVQLIQGELLNWDEKYNLLRKLTGKLNAAGEVWSWTKDISIAQVTALVLPEEPDRDA